MKLGHMGHMGHFLIKRMAFSADVSSDSLQICTKIAKNTNNTILNINDKKNVSVDTFEKEQLTKEQNTEVVTPVVDPNYNHAYSYNVSQASQASQYQNQTQHQRINLQQKISMCSLFPDL